MLSVENIKKELKKYANSRKGKILQRFFKTGKGQYGYGDIFLGVDVPYQRKIASQFSELTLKEIKELLRSKIHEERLTALIILVNKFKKEKTEENRKKIFEFYLENTKYINNWDLVDTSSANIIGSFLFNKNRGILFRLAFSNYLWEKRIAIISTYFFIKKGEHQDTFNIAKILISDKHDLIQKAVGWMLREVGKNISQSLLIDFLNEHYKKMGRTTLRYSLEKLPPGLKEKYMKGLI